MNGRWLSARTGMLGAGAMAAALVATAVTTGFVVRQRWEYSDIAASVLAGRGLRFEYLAGTTYYFYGTPVYPLFLAAILKATDSEGAVLVLQALIFAATAVLLSTLASRLFGPGEGLLAGVLVATHPGGLFFTGQLHSQTLDVFFVALAFVALLVTTPTTSRARAAAAGIAVGVAVLCRGPLLPIVGLWGLWFLWKHRRAQRRALGVMALVIGGVALTLAPVVARGYLAYGTLVPLRTDTGMNLWYGNHQGASGTSHTRTPPPEPVTSHLSAELRARLAGADEVTQHRILVDEVLEFARREPAVALALFVTKLGYFWWFSPHAGLFYPASWPAAYTVYYAVMLALGVAGVALTWQDPRTRDGAQLFAILAAGFSVTQALFYVEGRHRWQVEPLLLVFSALALVAGVRAVRARILGRVETQGWGTPEARPRDSAVRLNARGPR